MKMNYSESINVNTYPMAIKKYKYEQLIKYSLRSLAVVLWCAAGYCFYNAIMLWPN
jgi:hypothetical protein